MASRTVKTQYAHSCKGVVKACACSVNTYKLRRRQSGGKPPHSKKVATRATVTGVWFSGLPRIRNRCRALSEPLRKHHGKSQVVLMMPPSHGQRAVVRRGPAFGVRRLGGTFAVGGPRPAKPRSFRIGTMRGVRLRRRRRVAAQSRCRRHSSTPPEKSSLSCTSMRIAPVVTCSNSTSLNVSSSVP